MADAKAGVGERLGNVLIRMGRCSVESLARGVLAVVHHGKKEPLPKIADPILLESAVLLAEKIRKGELSSTAVVSAYVSRLREVNDVVNAVADSRLDEALQEAARADEFVRSGTMAVQQMEKELPLLGVPFTSKEACVVKGLSNTCGLVCRKGMVAAEDSEAVALLRNAGAIPIAVTNTSEICMWWETYNKLHGQTKNPYDTTRTVGGSSGGEAALIAAAGSVVGLGTDLGGSIRLPCFFCGIFGHKPSSGIVPYGGQFPPVLKEIRPYVVSGPMARYARDLRFLTKIFAGPQLTEKYKLDSQVPLTSIKVFFMMDDGGQPARSPVDPELKGAMQKILRWLQELGVSVKEAKVNNLKYGFMIWCAFLSMVKDQKISELMNGEVKSSEASDPLRQQMFKFFSGKSDHTFPIILNACMQDHVAPLLKKPLEEFAKRGLDLKNEMDALLEGQAVFLYPTYPTPAQRHGQMLVTPMNVGYTVVFNALGLPVTQCPLGLTSSGLPVGMQIVTAHGNDRLSLTMAEEIEKNFCGWMEPS